jgi:hypothetical protein
MDVIIYIFGICTWYIFVHENFSNLNTDRELEQEKNYGEWCTCTLKRDPIRNDRVIHRTKGRNKEQGNDIKAGNRLAENKGTGKDCTGNKNRDKSAVLYNIIQGTKMKRVIHSKLLTYFETLLRIPFPVIGWCSLVPTSHWLQGKSARIDLSQAASCKHF